MARQGRSENGAADIEFNVEVKGVIRRIEAELEHLKELMEAAPARGQRRRHNKVDDAAPFDTPEAQS